MAWAFITPVQLRNRVSQTLLDRLYDDDRDGLADVDPVEQMIADASGKVASYLQGITDLNAVQAAALAGTAHEVVRLTLDVAEYMAIKRHPEAAPAHDWVELMKAANTDLKMLRESFTKLDVEGPPNPPSNVGGVIRPASDSCDTARTFRVGGFGDF